MMTKQQKIVLILMVALLATSCGSGSTPASAARETQPNRTRELTERSIDRERQRQIAEINRDLAYQTDPWKEVQGRTALCEGRDRLLRIEAFITQAGGNDPNRITWDSLDLKKEDEVRKVYQAQSLKYLKDLVALLQLDYQSRVAIPACTNPRLDLTETEAIVQEMLREGKQSGISPADLGITADDLREDILAAYQSQINDAWTEVEGLELEHRERSRQTKVREFVRLVDSAAKTYTLDELGLPDEAKELYLRRR